MDAIAASAGVSKQTLYRYYATKERLFAAILQAFVQLDVPFLGEPPVFVVTQPQEFAMLLQALAHHIVAHLSQPSYLAFVRVVIAESPHFPHLSAVFHSAVITPGQQRFQALWDQAVHAGLVTPLPADIAMHNFIGPLLTFVLADGLFPRPNQPTAPSAEDITATVAVFLAAVTR